MRRVLALVVALCCAAPAVAGDELFPPIPACPVRGGPAVCRIERSLTAEEVTRRLGGQHTAFWVEDGVLTVVARRPGATIVEFCCALRTPMRRLSGSEDWTISLRLRDLDRAMLEVAALPQPSALGLQWRGPQAPPAPPSRAIEDLQHIDHRLNSVVLGPRSLTVWLPPGYSKDRTFPVVYAADGAKVLWIAAAAQPLIEQGRLPPMVMVGIEPGPGAERYEEYFDRRFEAHEAFFLREVMPFIEKTYSVSRDPRQRLLIGQSNGADWALKTAVRNPDKFRNVAGLSPAAYRAGGVEKPGGPKIYLVAGLYEQHCLENAQVIARTARVAGAAVQFETYASGHSPLMWSLAYPKALAFAFGPP